MASPPGTEDVSTELNSMVDGWNAAMGLRFVRATADEVVVEWEVGAQHRQPYGICARRRARRGHRDDRVGRSRHLRRPRRLRPSSGSKNHTSFIHAVRDGVLRATARPRLAAGGRRYGRPTFATRQGESSPRAACGCCASSPGPTSRAPR